MSGSTNPSTKWKIATAIFLVLTILGLGLSAYKTAQASDLSSKNSDLSAKADSLTTKLNADEQSITTLNSQISGLQAQIATLQAQHSTDLATIGHLQAELAANYTALQNLQKAKVIGIIQWDSTCNQFLGLCFICLALCYTNTVDAIAIANTGTNTADNIQASVTFYNGDMIVCTTPVIPLGHLAGQTIQGIQPNGATCFSSLKANHATFSSLTWS